MLHCHMNSPCLMYNKDIQYYGFFIHPGKETVILSLVFWNLLPKCPLGFVGKIFDTFAPHK